MAAKTSWHRYGTKLRHCHPTLIATRHSWSWHSSLSVCQRVVCNATDVSRLCPERIPGATEQRPSQTATHRWDFLICLAIMPTIELFIPLIVMIPRYRSSYSRCSVHHCGIPHTCTSTDGMQQGSTSHSTQNRSFRRRSSQPISWLGTEKPNPTKLTTQNQSDLRHRNTN